jgi:hypothetical protein
MSGPPPLETFDLSGLLAVPQSTRVIYQNAWNTFERVQNYNWTISTIRSTGDKSQVYYTYADIAEMNAFIVGRFLHVQRYPASNWLPVSKD